MVTRENTGACATGDTGSHSRDRLNDSVFAVDVGERDREPHPVMPAPVLQVL